MTIISILFADGNGNSMKTVQTRVTTRSRKAIAGDNQGDVVKGVAKSNLKNPKVVKKRTRRALADRTNSNSGSDLNSSSPSKKILKSAAKACPTRERSSEKRPKRTRQVPLRFQDHLLSPVSSQKKSTGSFTSTPLSSSLSANIKSQITCKLSPIEEPVSDNSHDKSKSVRVNKSPKIKVVNSNRKITKTKPTSSRNTPINTNSKVINKDGSTSSKRMLRNANSKTQRKTTVDKVLIFGNKSDNIQNKTSIQSPKCTVPVYKKNIIGDELRENDKSMLYEFEFDPTNEPKMVKKKKINRNKKSNVETKNPVRKKKKMSRKSADLAMKNLIEDLKKIQAEKIMKKLIAKIKTKETRNVENNASVNLPSASIQNLSNTNTTPSIQPLQSNNSNDDNPPSPLILEDMDLPDMDHESNPPCVSYTNNESLRFSNHPMANSSAIVNDKPNCSPWRMDLDSDVKKWRYNFPVKPSMTPAYERDTFHVLGLDDKPEKNNTENNSFEKNNMQNNAVASSTPIKPVEPSENTKKFLQTSILSFYADAFKKSPQKRVSSKNKPKKYDFDKYSSCFDFSNEKDCEVENISVPIENVEPAVENCFGFDDSLEDVDQENLSPINKKKSPEKRSKRIKKNVASILKEINNRDKNVLRNIERPIAPIRTKHNSPKKSPIIERSSIFSQENISEDNTTNVNSTVEENPEKECPLFEDPADVEVVHYNKVRDIFIK